jgi:hypothetical protein
MPATPGRQYGDTESRAAAWHSSTWPSCPARCTNTGLLSCRASWTRYLLQTPDGHHVGRLVRHKSGGRCSARCHDAVAISWMFGYIICRSNLCQLNSRPGRNNEFSCTSVGKIRRIFRRIPCVFINWLHVVQLCPTLPRPRHSFPQ